MKDKELEYELDRTYKLGECLGLERAAGIILEDALAYYKNKRDDHADLLRSLADRIGQMAKLERPKDRP